ncbi:MAG: CDP-alcohol phosphatidyltransferase family protein [Bacteroidales bacterium]|nr:CDP-alcohol phosphatidyltransferase family protein [Bacteroidales bacterium]
MKKHIPNIITLCNFLCGTLSVISLLSWKNDVLAAMFIIFGGLFDFFDGLTARALKVSSPIGKELDSLADVVTFGIAPSLIVVEHLLNLRYSFPFLHTVNSALCYLPLFMAVMSCYRLAKFNTDTRQSSSFIGLPTPANALIWLSIPITAKLRNGNLNLWGPNIDFIHTSLYNCFFNPYFILVCCVVCGILLVCELPLFSLKFKNLSWKDNKIKYIFLAISLLLIILLNFFSIPLIIMCYILLSIVDNLISDKNYEEK